MIEIKNLKQYNQFNERGVQKVAIKGGYVIVNDEFKCNIKNFSTLNADVFIFGKKVDPRVAKLFNEANYRSK